MVESLARQPAKIRTLVVALGESRTGAGELAASLVLREVCCGEAVRYPPTKVLVVTDTARARQGYLGFRIAPDEIRQLLNAWRVRAAGAGKSPGNLTVVEQALIRRSRGQSNVAPHIRSQSLHVFFPAYRLTDAGALVPVASRDHLRAEDAPPVITFADLWEDSPEGIERVGIDPDWVILECSTDLRRLSSRVVLAWCERFPRARHLCLIPGLSTPVVDQLRGRGFRVCWLRDTTASPLSTIKREDVKSPIPQADLDRLLAALAEGRRAIRRSDGASERAAMNALVAAIVAITALPVDRASYDAAAIERFGVPTTDELIQALSEWESRLAVTCPPFAAEIEEARSILAYALAAIDADNDRKARLLKGVEQAITTSRGLCVVVRNRTTRSAVEGCLTTLFETDVSDLMATGIRVEARRDLRPEAIPERMELLWTSYGGLQDLDTILGLSGRTVTVLVNQLERELLARDLRILTNRAAAAQDGITSFGLTLPGRGRLVDELAQLASDLSAPVHRGGTAMHSAEIYRLFEDAFRLVGPTGTAGVALRNGIVRPALTIWFESGSSSEFPEHGVVTIIRGTDDRPSDVVVTELRPGDRVVFIDRTIGRTIYELMQEQLMQSPLVGSAAQVVAVWHRAVAAAYAKSDLSVMDVLSELRKRGSSITTTQTVRYWLRGGVLGPRDTSDIERLSMLLGIGQREPALLKEIEISIRSLRNVYRQFAKIVYRTILIGGTGRSLTQSEQLLLEEHAISLEDLQAAITTETVMTVAPYVEPRPMHLIGRRSNE